MTKLEIRTYPDPVLRMQAVHVEAFDGDLQTLAAAMERLLDEHRGVGLAAPQVGVLSRVIVARIDPAAETLVLINPVVRQRSGRMEWGPEGCLSLPGAGKVDVERFTRIHLTAQDTTGQSFETQAEGLLARVLQHEIDHLDGRLILDRVSARVRRSMIEAMERRSRTVTGRAIR